MLVGICILIFKIGKDDIDIAKSEQLFPPSFSNIAKIILKSE